MATAVRPTTPAPPHRRRRRGRDMALLLCVGSLVLLALLSWLSVNEKSPTVDETTHLMGAWANYHLHDYRLDPENPPLWQYWVALPLGPLTADFDSGAWRVIPETMSARGAWQINTLYRTPGNDPDALVARGRAMMLLVALASGALLGWWGWKAGGPVAAAAAMIAFALDPSVLAHAPLIKNDLVLAGAVLWAGYALWRIGQRASWPRVISLAVATGVAVTVKFSGLLLAPIVVLVLAARALLQVRWPVLGRERATRGQRLLAAGGICAGVAVTTYAFIWLAYGFRFAPTPDLAVRCNMQEVVDLAARNALYARRGSPPTTQEVAQHSPATLVRAALWAESHRLLPHAWLYGFLSLYAQSQVRPGYLLGQYGTTGWWYYYPTVVLVKTPVATLVAGLLAAVVLTITARQKRDGEASAATFDLLWLAVCIAAPMIVYGWSAITSVHNAGIRHIFPLYLFAYLCIGLAVAKGWSSWPHATRITCGVLLAGLAAESLAAFPNYIPFFNVASSSHKLYLLSDSNIDWGQDLPLVAEWQAVHPHERLYLTYFGHADPGYYGINYVNLPGGYWYGEEPQLPREPGVIAISAMNLQGTYYDDRLRRLYEPLRRAKPLAVLGGGSIYLFRFPLPEDPGFPRSDVP